MAADVLAAAGMTVDRHDALLSLVCKAQPARKRVPHRGTPDPSNCGSNATAAGRRGP